MLDDLRKKWYWSLLRDATIAVVLLLLVFAILGVCLVDLMGTQGVEAFLGLFGF